MLPATPRPDERPGTAGPRGNGSTGAETAKKKGFAAAFSLKVSSFVEKQPEGRGDSLFKMTAIAACVSADTLTVMEGKLGDAKPWKDIKGQEGEGAG